MPVLRVSISGVMPYEHSCSVFRLSLGLGTDNSYLLWLQSQISEFVSLPCISGPKSTWEHHCRHLNISAKLSGVTQSVAV